MHGSARGPTLAQPGGVMKRRFPRGSRSHLRSFADAPTPLEQAVIDVAEFRARHLAWLDSTLELPEERDQDGAIVIGVEDLEILIDADVS